MKARRAMLRCVLALAALASAAASGAVGADVRALRARAESGDTAAQLELGLAHFHGRGVPEDDAAAFAWFGRAAAAGSAEAMYHLANLYALGLGVPAAETNADERAAQFYFEAARRGHAGAQHSLGLLYLTGKGVRRDTDEAAKWFKRAAAQGHPESRGFVGPAH